MRALRPLSLALVLLVPAAVAVGLSQAPTPADRAAAQQAEYERLMAMPRPIDAVDSVWIEDLTFMEVRDAQRAGKTMVIVPTGGIEQNGPYLTTGKHTHLNRVHCEAIARRLGNALCAPIVHFVPQGNIDPPSGLLRYPGTIGVTEATFKALLTDIANSFRVTGFEHVVLIGDSGGNQRGMREVAEELTPLWADTRSRIHYVPEYYDWRGATEFAETHLGWKQTDDGFHHDAVSASLMMISDPDSVRLRQQLAKGQAVINGIPLTPVESVVEAARRIVDYRVDQTVAGIHKALERAAAPRP